MIKTIHIPKHYLFKFELLCLILIGTFGCATPGHDLEKSVCGYFLEPFIFWQWSRAAGIPDTEILNKISNASAIEFQTKDGRYLRGYKLVPDSGGAQLSGFILVAQGNAMLAEHLLPHLQMFARSGLPVYIYDYRGYGRSEGKRRLQAITSDYQEIYHALRNDHQGRSLLYGISFGGIVMMNLIGSDLKFDSAVIDSAPSRLSPFGCPLRFDPVIHLPENASNILIITGGSDKVVTTSMSRELVEQAILHGGQVEVQKHYAHPFRDKTIELHYSRMRRIKEFLFQE
jgi:alpha/beta superfamily hydrolase